MDLVGSVEDSDVIIVDDMIDTAGTLCKAASVLKEFGGERRSMSKVGGSLCVRATELSPCWHVPFSGVGEGCFTTQYGK